MFIIESYAAAVFFCVITMLCWGSWANTQKLAKQQWPFQLYYWDYSFGILLITILLAFTLGSSGEKGRGFLLDLQQAEYDSFLKAFCGGLVFNLANLLLVTAIELSGMAIAFPIGIGLALVLGVITNYSPSQSGDSVLMWCGVALVLLAIALDAYAYRQLPQRGKNSVKGIIFSLLAGVTMGFFYQFVSDSMVKNFSQPESGKLTPYTALVLFAFGVVISGLLFNVINMYKPAVGKPATFRQYFTEGSTRLHLIGILGGCVWGIGMSFNILASEVAGSALAYGLGQGATMVAAIWGVFVWKEFKELPAGKTWILFGMFACFLSGIILLVCSK